MKSPTFPVGIRALPFHVKIVIAFRQEFAAVLRMSGEWLGGRIKIMERPNIGRTFLGIECFGSCYVQTYIKCQGSLS